MAGEAGNDGASVDDEARKEQARAERAAAAAAREQAALFNEQLGVAIVNSLSRVKVDDRVVKILTAINIASDLDRIAMRGARYGFPGWVTIEETKRGSKRVYIEQRGDAQAKAAQYLAGAKSAGELAGRTRRAADGRLRRRERRRALQPRVSHRQRRDGAAVGRRRGRADRRDRRREAPRQLMDPILEQRRARHAKRRALAAAKAAAIDRIAELAPQVDELDTEALDELEQLNVLTHGESGASSLPARWGQRRRALWGAPRVDPGQWMLPGNRLSAAEHQRTTDLEIDRRVWIRSCFKPNRIGGQ